MSVTRKAIYLDPTCDDLLVQNRGDAIAVYSITSQPVEVTSGNTWAIPAWESGERDDRKPKFALFSNPTRLVLISSLEKAGLRIVS